MTVIIQNYVHKEPRWYLRFYGSTTCFIYLHNSQPITLWTLYYNPDTLLYTHTHTFIVWDMLRISYNNKLLSQVNSNINVNVKKYIFFKWHSLSDSIIKVCWKILMIMVWQSTRNSEEKIWILKLQIHSLGNHHED